MTASQQLCDTIFYEIIEHQNLNRNVDLDKYGTATAFK